MAISHMPYNQISNLAERTQIVRDKRHSDLWDLARGIGRGDWQALVSWNLSQS